MPTTMRLASRPSGAKWPELSYLAAMTAISWPALMPRCRAVSSPTTPAELPTTTKSNPTTPGPRRATTIDMSRATPRPPGAVRTHGAHQPGRADAGRAAEDHDRQGGAAEHGQRLDPAVKRQQGPGVG